MERGVYNSSLQRHKKRGENMIKLSVLLALAIASVVLGIMDDFVPKNANIICKIVMIFVWVAIALISISILI